MTGTREWWSEDETFIREWAADRGLRPVARERADGETDLRLVPDPDDAPGQPLAWPAFFESLAERGQVLLYRGQAAAEGVDSDHPWAVIDRRAVPEQTQAAAKTEEPTAVDADQLAVSDTGEGEPVTFDETEDEPSPSDPADASNAELRDRARRGDPSDALVLETVHENRGGPDVGPLGAEHVTLRNDGETPLDLSGWRLRNEAGDAYPIPAGTTLPPSEQLTIHVGEGDDSHRDLYWDADGSVWPRDGGTVYVETATGDRVIDAPYEGGRD